MKRFILYSILLLLAVGQMQAQLPKWALDLAKRSELTDSATTPLVTYLDAVQPALTIVRQQYVLERNGDSFGRRKKPYYGETFSLGIKISGGTIVQRCVVLPWERDADYLRVNSNGKYEPAYFKSFQRSVRGGTWNSVELELGTQYIEPFTPDSLLYRHIDVTADFGLPIDETIGIKQGYMIWAYSTTDLQDSTMQVKFQQDELKVEIKNDGKPINVKNDHLSNILGGLFIVPQVERAGYIKLLLAGVAAKNKQGYWEIRSISIRNDGLTKVEEPTKIEKTRKKNNPTKAGSETNIVSDDSEPTPIK